MRLMSGGRASLHDTLDSIDRKIRRRAPLPDFLRSLDAAREPLRRRLSRVLGDSAVAGALTFKLLNLLLAKYHYQERSMHLHSRPLSLLVDPSNGCNLACPGCVQSTRAKSLKLFDWSNGLLTEDRFAAFLARYGPAVMQIMFCNYGEPLTNPNTPRLIRLSKDYLVQTALSTNFSIGRFDPEAYVRSGLDFMYLAIDGATQPVYARYRKNGDLAVIFRNIESLVAAKRRLGSRTPVLRWQYLAFEHNAHEIDQAVAMAKNLGVDQFALEIPFDVSWDDPGVHVAQCVHPFRREFTLDSEQSLAGNWGSVSGAALDAIERQLAEGWPAGSTMPESGPASPHTCNWLYRNMTLDANGRILPCCGAPKPGVDIVFGKWSPDAPDIFNSDPYLQARRSFADRPSYEASRSSGAPAPYCANCEWNQDHTEYGAAEVALYLRTTARGALDARAIDLCSNW